MFNHHHFLIITHQQHQNVEKMCNQIRLFYYVPHIGYTLNPQLKCYYITSDS